MVYHFKSLSLFKTLVTSTGTYTEGSVHKCAPKPTVLITGGNLLATLAPTPSTSIEVIPKNGDIFRRMEISTPYVPGPIPTRKELCNPTEAQPSFLTMEYESTNILVYGWIDDITAKVNKGNFYSYIIDWHVDWWLTAGNLASYGSGRLLRGPQSYARPSSVESRYWKYAGARDLVVDANNDPEDYWVLVVFTDASNNWTRLKMRYWQPGHAIPHIPNPYSVPDWSQIYSGYLDEWLELDPDVIIGAYICPTRPGPNLAGNIWLNTQQTMATYEDTLGAATGTRYMSWVTPYATDDFTKYVLVDPMGSVVGTVPWGLPFNKITMGLDIGTNGVNFLVHFGNGDTVGIGEGRTMTIPLQTLPVNSNAWSSYNYSGEREYDKTSKKIQQDQAAANGIAGIGTGIIGGAIAGSMVAPGPGTVAGAAAGAISGIVGLGVSYASTGNFNKAEQEAVDRLKSNQASNVILSAGGRAWQHYSSILGGRWQLVWLERDTVSAAELTAEQSEIGYATDTILASASTVIANKGPLRIQDLQVSGLCPEGNRYISAMFARGVHLD